MSASLKKQAKTYLEIAMMVEDWRKVFRDGAHGNQKAYCEARDTRYYMEEKKWIPEDVVLPFIADLKEGLDTQGEIADILWMENKRFEKQIVDLKEKLAESYKSAKKECKETEYLACACKNYRIRIGQLEKLYEKWKTRAKELEGRLSGIRKHMREFETEVRDMGKGSVVRRQGFLDKEDWKKMHNEDGFQNALKMVLVMLEELAVLLKEGDG